MKQFFVLATLLLLVTVATARNSSEQKSPLLTQRISIFNHIKFQINGDNVAFLGLPNKNFAVYVMDEHGIIEQSVVINRKRNWVNISTLPFGNHFIVLKLGLQEMGIWNDRRGCYFCKTEIVAKIMDSIPL